MKTKIGKRQLKYIDSLVRYFNDNHYLFEVLLNAVQTSVNSKLKPPLIHSVKYRFKDPLHLKDKLIRKAIEAKEKGRRFTITNKNLFSRINDLAGYRIIHLHTTQFQEIDKILKKIFEEQSWVLHEGPIARTWDDESREYFKQIGINIKKSPSMYTSVHYIIKANESNPVTCEIQVRTLMEEVWGEVDHTINYPHRSTSLSVREQIKALARVTSSCSRLVDSIFSTHNDHISATPIPLATKAKAKKKKATK